MLAVVETQWLSISSVGAAKKHCSNSIFLFSFISWNEFIQRHFPLSATWSPSGAAHIGKKGQVIGSFIYLVLKMIN